MLLLDAFSEVLQVLHGRGNLAFSGFKLRASHQRCRTRQAAAGTIGDGEDHGQIAPQLLGGGCRWRRHLLVYFQEQLRRIENAPAYRRGRIAPCRVQFTGLAAAEAMPGKHIGHALTIVAADTGHRRQILHSGMGGDLAVADPPLHGVRNLFDQRQPAGDPTEAAIEPARQILQAVAEALFQFLKQPALFQRRFACGQAHRLLQHQGFGVAHIPNDPVDGVAAELLQGCDAFESIDYSIAAGTFGIGGDHNRGLLSRTRHRRQQPVLPLGTAHSQMLIPPVELMKLQLHGSRFLCGRILEQAGSGIARRWREVCPEALQHQQHRL